MLGRTSRYFTKMVERYIVKPGEVALHYLTLPLQGSNKSLGCKTEAPYSRGFFFTLRFLLGNYYRYDFIIIIIM